MDEINIPSPCTAKCEIDKANGLCQGCFRTTEEITNWTTLKNQTKLNIVKQLHVRRNQINGTPVRISRRRVR